MSPSEPDPSGAADAPRLDALEALYDAHHRYAIGVAYRMLGDLGDAEEVVQEVFLSAWRAGHTYDPSRGSTRVWLLAMVRNRSIDVLRARRRRPSLALDEQPDQPTTESVVDEAAVLVDSAVARLALESLPPEQKQAIELAFFGGLSHSEIANQIGVPVGTVKGRIRLAMDRLRTALGVGQDALAHT